MASFNGLGMHLGNLPILSKAESRSISPENPTGEKGKGAMASPDPVKSPARKLGRGWKVSPYIAIEPGEVKALADIAGAGAIAQIWMTPTGLWRSSILRIYWDDSPTPSVECPVGDFFACGWNRYAQVSSLAVCVNPGSAFNCYWEMPFRKRCRITMTNTAETAMILYYQINYSLTEVTNDAAYFHAQFRRVNPLQYKDVYTILDGVTGRGQFVGTYLAWGVHNNGWWGEGEVKFYVDGDTLNPTINGTGEEDYFLGSYSYLRPAGKLPNGDPKLAEETFSSLYSGFYSVMPLEEMDPAYRGTAERRLGEYRWHIVDPIRFDRDLKVTIQALGWKA